MASNNSSLDVTQDVNQYPYKISHAHPTYRSTIEKNLATGLVLVAERGHCWETDDHLMGGSTHQADTRGSQRALLQDMKGAIQLFRTSQHRGMPINHHTRMRMGKSRRSTREIFKPPWALSDLASNPQARRDPQQLRHQRKEVAHWASSPSQRARRLFRI